MENFKARHLADWDKVESGEKLLFEANAPRRVRFMLISEKACNVYAQIIGDATLGEEIQPVEQEPVLVASFTGQAVVEYTAPGPSIVQIAVEDGASAWIMDYTADVTRMPRPELENYTNIEPRTRRNSDIDRLMQLMRINSENTERVLSEQRKRISELETVKKKEVDDAVLEENPAKVTPVQNENPGEGEAEEDRGETGGNNTTENSAGSGASDGGQKDAE